MATFPVRQPLHLAGVREPVALANGEVMTIRVTADTTLSIGLRGDRVEIATSEGSAFAVVSSAGVGRFMTVTQCAAHIGVTPNALYIMVHRNEIPYLKVGRRVRFDRDRIDRWMMRQAYRASRL